MAVSPQHPGRACATRIMLMRARVARSLAFPFTLRTIRCTAEIEKSHTKVSPYHTSAANSVGHQKNYVFDLSVRLRLRACSPSGLPSTSNSCCSTIRCTAICSPRVFAEFSSPRQNWIRSDCLADLSQRCHQLQLLIYRPRKDERLSWPSWLTSNGTTVVTDHFSGSYTGCGRKVSL